MTTVRQTPFARPSAIRSTTACIARPSKLSCCRHLWRWHVICFISPCSSRFLAGLSLTKTQVFPAPTCSICLVASCIREIRAAAHLATPVLLIVETAIATGPLAGRRSRLSRLWCPWPRGALGYGRRPISLLAVGVIVICAWLSRRSRTYIRRCASSSSIAASSPIRIRL